MSEESVEIVNEEWCCFVLEHSEVHVSMNRNFSFAQRLDCDDDDEDVIVLEEEKILFEEEIELFENDILLKTDFERYLEYRKGDTNASNEGNPSSCESDSEILQ